MSFCSATRPFSAVLITTLLFTLLGLGCQSNASSKTASDIESSAREASATFNRTVETDAIRALLSEQQAAWNRGDLEGFMQGYAQTDTLRFASGGSVRTGWQTTLDNYRKGYPDRAAMGQLAFSDLNIEVMDATWAMVFGRWQLQRESDAPGGLFTLILHRAETDAPWRIIHDHTSSGAK